MTYKVPFVNYQEQYATLRAPIQKAISRVLSEGQLILREDVLEFEKNLTKFVGAKYAVGVASGTDALMLSLRAAGIGQGDEVITVAHTFLASIASIVHAGATSILVDIGDDYLIDPSLIERAITKRTKAIMPVYLNGRVCEMDAITKIAKKYRLLIIEDACQALGASFKGKRAGSFGIAGCFSFYPAKLLGSYGDAGAITTNNKTIYERIRLYRDHGRVTKDKFVCYGVTSRLDNIQAAVLNVKFKYVNQWITRRKMLARLYAKGLEKIKEVTLPPFPDKNYDDVFQNFVIRAKRRNELKEYLAKYGVETIVSNPIPLNKQKALKLSGFSLPKTEQFAREVISLPMIPELNQGQILFAIKTIKNFYKT